MEGHNLAIGHSLASVHILVTGHNLSTGDSLSTGHKLSTGRTLATGHDLDAYSTPHQRMEAPSHISYLVTVGSWSNLVTECMSP